MQFLQKAFDLLPLGNTGFVAAGGQLTGTLQKIQSMVARPCDNIPLLDAVQRPDQLHTGEIFAAQFGRHTLQLRAVEHTHYRCLNHIVEMMTQRNLVAAKALRLLVKVTAPHSGTQITGIAIGVVGGGEDIRLKHRDRDRKPGRVFLYLMAVGRGVTGVHDKKRQIKRHFAVAVQFLHQLGKQHGVLPA